MNECPVHKVRSDLPPLIPRIKALPVDERGYPVPYFVHWIDGKPDFRIMDPTRFKACIKLKLCWVCGQPLGRFKSFVIGPMCAITRTTSEPPSHHDCAEWSVQACPFMVRPQAKRREDEISEAGEKNVAGYMIKRNPGVSCVWTTERYTVFDDGAGKPLIKVGPPDHVSWWRQGRRALKPEVLESIKTGYPILLEACRTTADRTALEADRSMAMNLLPPI